MEFYKVVTSSLQTNSKIYTDRFICVQSHKVVI